MEQNKKLNLLEVDTIFAENSFFLANNGKFYFYKMINGVIKVFEKIGETRFTENRKYLDLENREESDF